MKWSCNAYLAIILVFVSAFIFQSPQAKENSLKKGKWALQFEIDRNFDLSGFQGSTLSIKKQKSDNRAYRLGSTIEFEYADGVLDRPPYGPGNSPGDRVFTSQRFEVTLQKLYYTDNTASVNLFFGVGPSVSYFYSKDKRDTRNNDNSYVDYLIHKNCSFSAGALGSMGVEWFFNKDISLLAEYGTSILYKASSRENDRRHTQSGSQYNQYDFERTNGFTFMSNAVKFGLSVYF